MSLDPEMSLANVMIVTTTLTVFCRLSRKKAIAQRRGLFHRERHAPGHIEMESESGCRPRPEV